MMAAAHYGVSGILKLRINWCSSGKGRNSEFWLFRPMLAVSLKNGSSEYMNNELTNYIRNEADETLVREAFLQASQYFSPLGSLARLWHALDKAKNQKERVEVARDLMLIREVIKRNQVAGYIVLTEGFRMWVEKNSFALSLDELMEITDAALASAERIGEKVFDSENRKMGIDELRRIRMELAKKD
jgi:hypothetical protein